MAGDCNAEIRKLQRYVILLCSHSWKLRGLAIIEYSLNSLCTKTHKRFISGLDA